MRKLAIAVVTIAVTSGCTLPTTEPVGSTTEALTQEGYRALAQNWAPRFYQDTDSTFYKGDFITKFNYDGDYVGKNNWNDLDAFSTVPAHVYYAVSETDTHYFINYGVFHPRDWDDSGLPGTQHENDFEGLSVVVLKGGTFGTLVALETLAHDQFYQYAYASGITSGTDNVDGTITLFGTHPRIFIEAKGHGIFNCDGRCDSAPGGDGIVYYEGGAAGSPSTGAGNWTSAYPYKLIAMDADGSLDGNEGFWYRRNDICDGCTFGSWGKLRGDDFGTDKAKMPWAWDDADDGQVFAGDMLCDPAVFFDAHLNGTPFNSGFSHNYTTHPFRTHMAEVLAARSDANRDPFGGASDIYVKITAPGSPAGTDDVLDARAWKKNNAPVGTWYAFSYGGYDAEGEHSFGASFGTHSFCRPGTPAVTFAVYDSDTDADDFMGSIAVSGTTDDSAGIDLGDSELKFRLTRYP
jgi:hypothetical protein